MKQYIIILGLITLLFLTACSKTPEVQPEFAQCLTDYGATMYGTEWCSHCQNQKAEFGKSFNLVNFVDCDINQNRCIAAGVKGYPTWIIDDKAYPGEQSLERLAYLTGCELDNEQV
jgi:hypothetical protein